MSNFVNEMFRKFKSVKITRDVMAISHELSSEIASALLAAKDRSPRELEDLRKTLLIVHSTLQRLTEEERVAHLESRSAARKASASGGI